ncbi:MAG: alcohol dehydrogenase catalytic domain-containing protein [Treponema sp.]|jgi:L-iditol 2-dehydrogenase|nr:alcohol dehydrogenase catalytic domain-containing protein [Treponema sp.]
MGGTMKAAMYYNNKDIRIEEVPIPEIDGDEILVKTIACGLCGGEAMEWYHIKRAPKVMGHEPAGIIAKAGRDVKKFKEGDRVFVNHHVPRLNSHQSLRGHFTKDDSYKNSELKPGGMCEYFKASAAHVENGTFLLPGWMDYGTATLLEPWGCVLGGLKVSGIRPGDTVAVVGCGFMGQGFIHLSRLFGAGLVFACDLSDWRLNKALEMGATATLNPEKEDIIQKMRDLNDGRKADVVIMTVPSIKTLEQAIQMAETGGTVHMNAPPPAGQVLNLIPADLYDREMGITTKYSADQFDIYQLFRLFLAKRLEPEKAITHKFELDGINEAFSLLIKGGQSLKSVIYPNGINAVS